MNKTRTYIFFSLLTVLMVTACTLEGDLDAVRKKAGIEDDYYYDPGTPSNTIDLPPFNQNYYDGVWYYSTEYYSYLPDGVIHYYRFYVSNPGIPYLIEYSRGIQVAVKKEGASSYIVGMTDDGIIFYPPSSGYYILALRTISSINSGFFNILVEFRQ